MRSFEKSREHLEAIHKMRRMGEGRAPRTGSNMASIERAIENILLSLWLAGQTGVPALTLWKTHGFAPAC